MKKFLIISAIFAMAFSTKTNAQDEDAAFKPFKVDVSGGYALPIGGSGSKGGFLFAIEPKYAVMPQLSLGLRVEAAITISGIQSNGDVYSNASAKAASSYLATGDYYFSNNDFRPFIGAGAGIYQTAGVSLADDNTNTATGSKFGGIIRGGFEYKHGRFGVEYNLVGKTVSPKTTTSESYEIKNAYIGIKFGVCIGGGRL
ncbi:MAG: hypothetical protein H7Z13_16840 [Ferruginibacter sp.]|nr:hypothetical protein [Ferruginibacter sp.]